jgi:hypothetical protein
MSLEIFPSEILRDIADYSQLGSIIKLILCGNKRLTERLCSSSGVRRIDWLSRGVHRKPILPPLVAQMKGIKMVEIFLMTNAETDFSAFCDQLPPDLHSLEVDTALDLVPKLWEQLRSQKLAIQSLQALGLLLPAEDRSSLVGSLPTSLTALRLPQDTILGALKEFGPDHVFPPLLQSLHLLPPCNDQERPYLLNFGYFKKLPSLEELIVDTVTTVLFRSDTFPLPHLRRLDLEKIAFYKNDVDKSRDPENFPKFCRLLPSSLKYFRHHPHLSQFAPTEMPCLENMRSWHLRESGGSMAFPPNVTELRLLDSIPASNLFLAALPKMPRSLTFLDLRKVTLSQKLVEVLPRTVTSLVISVPRFSDVSSIILPPSLTVLQIEPSTFEIETAKVLVKNSQSPSLHWVVNANHKLACYRLPPSLSHTIRGFPALLEMPDGAKWVTLEMVFQTDSAEALAYILASPLYQSLPLKLLLQHCPRRCMDYLVSVAWIYDPMGFSESSDLFCELISVYHPVITIDMLAAWAESPEHTEIHKLPQVSIPSLAPSFLDSLGFLLNSGYAAPFAVAKLAQMALALDSLEMFQMIAGTVSTPCAPLSTVLRLSDLLLDCIQLRNSTFGDLCMFFGATEVDFPKFVSIALKADFGKTLEFVKEIDPNGRIVTFGAWEQLLTPALGGRLLDRRQLIPLLEWLRAQYGAHMTAFNIELVNFCLLHSEQSHLNQAKPGQNKVPDWSDVPVQEVEEVLIETATPYSHEEILSLVKWLANQGLDLASASYGNMQRSITHFATNTLNLPLLQHLFTSNASNGNRYSFTLEDRAGMTPFTLLMQEAQFAFASLAARSDFSNSTRRRTLENKYARSPETLLAVVQEEDKIMHELRAKSSNAQSILQFWNENILPTHQISPLHQEDLALPLLSATAVKKNDYPSEPGARIVRPPRRRGNQPAAQHPAGSSSPVANEPAGISSPPVVNTSAGSSSPVLNDPPAAQIPPSTPLLDEATCSEILHLLTAEAAHGNGTTPRTPPKLVPENDQAAKTPTATLGERFSFGSSSPRQLGISSTAPPSTEALPPNQKTPPTRSTFGSGKTFGSGSSPFGAKSPADRPSTATSSTTPENSKSTTSFGSGASFGKGGRFGAPKK